MFRKTSVIAAVAAAMVMGGASAAFADDGSSGGDAGYTPHTTTHELTLAGSVASSMCIGNVPWIDFTVALTDPDNVAKGHTARLVLADSTHSYTMTLGPLGKDNKISGRVLWPGAKVVDGKAVGWPGWTTKNGQLVPTTGNFAWTRGHITGTLEVNPSLSVPISYPPATSACAGPVPTSVKTSTTTGGTQGELAQTGLSVPVVPIAIGGAVIIAAGAALMLTRRRHS